MSWFHFKGEVGWISEVRFLEKDFKLTNFVIQHKTKRETMKVWIIWLNKVGEGFGMYSYVVESRSSKRAFFSASN